MGISESHRFDPASVHGIVADQSPCLEGAQSSLHGPSTPPTVEHLRVGEDVVEMLDGRVGDGVVLVERVGTAYPAQAHARCGGDVGEVGVFTAVAGVFGAESTDPIPGVGCEGKRQ